MTRTVTFRVNKSLGLRLFVTLVQAAALAIPSRGVWFVVGAASGVVTCALLG